MRLSLDLPPLLGVVSETFPIRLERPGPEALEECIAGVRSGRADERFKAVDELAYFTDDGDRVVPVLIGLLEDRLFRSNALDALVSFPEHAAKHTDRYLAIVLRGQEWDRVAALNLVGEVAPDTPFVRRVLRAAAKARSEHVVEAARGALERLEKRSAPSRAPR